MIDVDLFEGAGGAATGLRSIGVEPVGFEWNADACATARAAGHHIVRADLSVYPWHHVRGRVRLMHGSPPCQPFSAAGDGAGEDDTRDGMPWMLRAIDEARPLVITIENVPGLLHTKHARYFGAFIETLRSYGYVVDWRVLNTADWGVPQCRRRLIVVARRDGTEIRWPEITHVDGGGMFHTPWVTMAAALGWGWDTPARTVCGDRSPRWQYAGGSTTGRTLHTRCGYDGVEVTRRDVQPAPTVTAKAFSQWVWERPATSVSCDPRISPPGHHDAAVSGSQQAGAIRVSLDELATLQGFPPGYPFHGNRTSVARQIGNALPPPLIAAVVAANLGAAA